MKTLRIPILILLAAPLLAAEPVKLIFDTDMGNDVDDLIALAMIHSLQGRRACELLAEAYYLYEPPPHDRPTWDATAGLYAVYPDRGYFDLSPPGTVTVEDNAATWFRPSWDGKGSHRFLVMSPEQTARVREAIVPLSSVPPGARP